MKLFEKTLLMQAVLLAAMSLLVAGCEDEDDDPPTTNWESTLRNKEVTVHNQLDIRVTVWYREDYGGDFGPIDNQNKIDPGSTWTGPVFFNKYGHGAIVVKGGGVRKTYPISPDDPVLFITPDNYFGD